MRLIRFIWSIFNNLRRFLHLLLLLLIFAFLGIGLQVADVYIPDSAALVVAPSGVLVEQLEGRPFDRALAELTGEGLRQTLVRDVTDSLEYAATDDRITAVVLVLDGLDGGGLSKLQTIGAAIREVRDAGKKVVAVGDGFTQEQYFLAAQADEIFMHAFGTLYIDGYGYYRTYLRDIIEKLKIDLNVFRVGEYKSFVEPFIRDDMSDEDKEASARWLGSLWSSYQRDVVEARGLEAGSLDNYANGFLQHLRNADGDAAQAALDAGLVDVIGGRDQFRDYLIELVGESDEQVGTYSSIDFQTYLYDVRPEEGSEARESNVGVLVASGEIVDGFGPLGTIGGDSFAELVNQAANDDSIDALVLRIDSPGGSVFASEVVFAELRALKSRGIPLIASMSSVAASGGYYIAMPADEIWASENSITGSIGVGALLPTFQRSLDAIGIHVDGIGTTSMSGEFRSDLALSSEAEQMLQLSIDSTYQMFIGKVADSRGLTVEQADRLARGRVWIGADALELGLIDELGTLDQAIAAAASRAGLTEGDYGVKYIKPTLSLGDRLALGFGVRVMKIARVLGVQTSHRPRNVLAGVIDAVERELGVLARLNDPRGLYYHCLCQLPGS
jgi:protease-4